MNRLNKKNIGFRQYIFILLCGLLPWFAGCTNSDTDMVDPVSSGASVKLQLHTSGLANVQNIDREDLISRMTVLAFDDQDVFAYKARTGDITSLGGNAYEITVYLRVDETGDSKYSFAFLANSEGPYNLEYHVGKTVKEDLLKLFTFKSNANTEDKYSWSKDTAGNDRKPIPMYAETGLIKVHENMQFPNNGEIILIRAMAKLDIFMDKAEVPTDGTAGGGSIDNNAYDYVLEELYVYNTVNKGYIACQDYLKHLDIKGDNKVSLWGASLTAADFNNRIRYIYSSSNTLKNSVLLSENDLINESELPEEKGGRTIMVVGLSHPTKLNGTRYFKLDMLGDEAINPVKSIIRNNHYVAHIMNVEGEGETDPDETLKTDNKCVIDITVIPWNTVEIDAGYLGEEEITVEERKVVIPCILIPDPNSSSSSDLKLLATWKPKVISISTKLTEELIKLIPSQDGSISGNLEASDDYFTYEMNLRAQTLTITPKVTEMSLSAGQKIPSLTTTLLIKAGKIEIPIEIIKGGTEGDQDLQSNYAIQVIPHGAYVVGDQLNKGLSSANPNYPTQSYLNNLSHYMELRIPYDGEKVKVGSEVVAGTIDSNIGGNFYPGKNNGFLFRMVTNPSSPQQSYVYKIEKEDIKYFMNEKGVLSPYAVVKIPGLGKPERARLTPFVVGVTVLTDSQIYSDQYYFANVEVYRCTPSYKPAKILFIADGYNFDPEDKNNSNIAKLLFSRKIFGLDLDSEFKVEPYTRTIYSNNSNITKVIAHNVTHINSLDELRTPAALLEYDIVFYINSKIENELYNAGQYVQKIADLVRTKKLIFIQTPSYLSPFSGCNSEYYEPLMSYLLNRGKAISIKRFEAKQNYIVTPQLTRYIPSRTISSYYYNNSIHYKKSVTLNYNHKIHYPYPVNTSSKPIRPHVSYINPKSSNSCYSGSLQNYGLKEWAQYSVTKTRCSNSSKSHSVMVKAEEYNYIWLGSNTFFNDESILVHCEQPLVANHILSYCCSTYKTNTYSSTFYVLMLQWAIDQFNSNL